MQDDVTMAGDGVPECVHRVGIGVLTNEEFEQRSIREVRKMQADLAEISKNARAQLSQCWGQYHVTAEEIRSKKEQELVSEMVTKELDVFKQELKRREETEDERLRHLYNSILQKDEGARHGDAPRVQKVEQDTLFYGRHVNDSLITADGVVPIIQTEVRFPADPRRYEPPTMEDLGPAPTLQRALAERMDAPYERDEDRSFLRQEMPGYEGLRHPPLPERRFDDLGGGGGGANYAGGYAARGGGPSDFGAMGGGRGGAMSQVSSGPVKDAEMEEIERMYKRNVDKLNRLSNLRV